ncbi:MAG: glycosyltransferase [Acidimicrobiaceae bacterium]|nr:glycosyltransferase [Acidimicrobiaceae bacterium]
MKTSVIICAYTLDRWADLVAAVNSCRDQSLLPDEIVVVIDYNDELLERARVELPGTTVLSNVAAKGLSGARNTGVVSSSGDLIAFLDDDAWADSRWLEHLIAPMQDPLIAGVGGWVVPSWPSSQPDWFPKTFYWVLGSSYEGLPSDGSQIRNPIGANMAFRREVFTAVGGFTDGIGRIGRNSLGCEETELAIRFTNRFPASSFLLCRDAVVFHRVPQSRLTWSYFLRRCWAEGLSKAAVSSLVGSSNGLASERRHLSSAIPHELLDSLRGLRRSPGASTTRMALTILGSCSAVAGLIRGTWSVRRNPIRSIGLDDKSSLDLAPSDSTLEQLLLNGATRPVGTDREDLANQVVDNLDASPVRLVQASIDEVPGTTDLGLIAGERVMIEVLRHGHVVGVVERRADQDGISASMLDELAQQFASVQTSRGPRVVDDLLPRFTVVVPTIYRRKSQLVETIESLLDMDYPTFDIVIVDNRSVGPDHPIPAFEDAKVRVVSEPIPGISAARNRGVAESTGEYVAFTDDDVVVDRLWLRELGTRLITEPDIDAIGGMVRPREIETKPQYWFEEYFGGFSKIFEAESWSLQAGPPDDPMFPYAPGKFAAGCNMAIRRATIEAVGGFDERLGTGTPTKGGEDLAMLLRIVLEGGKVAFEPQALVRHSHRRSEADFMTQVFGYGTGLTAMYTALIVNDPGQLVSIVRRIPTGLKILMERRNSGTRGEVVSYPKATQRHEILGMLYGPIAYARSSLKSRSRS